MKSGLHKEVIRYKIYNIMDIELQSVCTANKKLPGHRDNSTFLHLTCKIIPCAYCCKAHAQVRLPALIDNGVSVVANQVMRFDSCSRHIFLIALKKNLYHLEN